MSHDERKRALNSACRSLTRRAHSRYELKKKLERKKFSHDAIRAVLAELETQRLLDDRAFSMSFARYRLQRRQLGRDRMVLELKARGISKALIDETLGPLYCEIDEQTLAQEAVEKKQRAMKRPRTASDHRRLADFLRRRGFSYEVIQKVLKSDHDLN
jgi:regulatory protein